MKGRADRPPQLNVVSNPLSESPAPYDPGPKSPVEPTEFEVWFTRLLFELKSLHLTDFFYFHFYSILEIYCTST